MDGTRKALWAIPVLAAAAALLLVLALRKSPSPAGAPPSSPAAPAAGTARGAQLQLVAQDGRAVTSCRVVSLASRRVIAGFDGSSGGPPKVDLPIRGEVQRLLVLPDDPALAPAFVEVDPGQVKYGPATAVFPPGLETSGVVVDSRGQPLAGAEVCAEIPFDPDFPTKDESLVELPRKGGAYGFNENVLSIRTTTDKEGRFQLDGLPASVTKLKVVRGKAQVEHAVSGDVARIVVPDEPGK